MSESYLSRRKFLGFAVIAGGGLVAAACGGSSTPTTAAAGGGGSTTTAAGGGGTTTVAPPAETVVLDVLTSPSEYEGPYREIWNFFESTHPGIEISLFSINEDTAAAHEAKVAGGFLPAIEDTTEQQLVAGADNFETFVDLSTIDFPYFDKWTWDLENTWSNLFGQSGPRTISPFQGFVLTWQWNEELMQRAGLDPVNDVKTWEDQKAWLDEGTAWAAAQDDVSFFWNQAWHNWVFGVQYPEILPLAFADGGRQRLVDCWLGEAKFNADDSPYRHHFDFFLEANNKGWIPSGLTTRQWEGDMETSYIAGDSVMMFHGPWVWDKALAAGSDFAINDMQRGMPVTAPADGQAWKQAASPPSIADLGLFMRTGNKEAANWEQTLTAWNWIHSPEAIPLRAEAEGRAVTYKLDEPLDIAGPQYKNVLKEIGTPGGKWEDASFEEGQTGEVLAAPFRIKGSVGVFDWEANGNNVVMADLLSGAIDVQGALDILQSNWEASYEI